METPVHADLRPVVTAGMEDVELNDVYRESSIVKVYSPNGTPGTPGFKYAGRRTRMSQRVATRLEKIDTNHDGRISTTELEDAIEQLLREEQKHRSYKCMAWGVAGLLLFVLLANLGLAYAVVLLSKELDVQGNVLISTDTGDPVEVNSASFFAEDGALRGRGSLDTGVPLETSAQPFVHDMATSYSDDYLAEVRSIRLSWASGGSAVLGVKAFARPGGVSSGQLTVMTDVGFLTIKSDGVILADNSVEVFLMKTGVINGTSGGEAPTPGLRRRLLQGSGIYGIETFGQFMGHTTAVCEIQAAQRAALLGATYEEELAVCQQRALVRRARGGGFVIETEVSTGGPIAGST